MECNGTHAFVYERKGPLAIMGNMILSKHLEHIWPSTHRLRGPSSSQGLECNERNASEIRTYTEIAKETGFSNGHPNSARAVANACGQNPYPPIVPCLELVRSDGSLGGYSGVGGVETKRRLLSEEGVSITPSRSK